MIWLEFWGGGIASTEGGSVPSGVGWGGVSPPQPTRGSEGASWAPQRVRSRDPTENGLWRILKATKRSFSYIWHNLRGWQFALASPIPNSGGTCPLGPVIYAHATTITTRNVGRERSDSPAMNQAIVKQPINDSETWQNLMKVECSPSGSFTWQMDCTIPDSVSQSAKTPPTIR